MVNMNKKQRIGIFLVFVIILWLVSFAFINPVEKIDSNSYIQEKHANISDISSFNFNNSKKILYYNNYFHLKHWRFGVGNEPFVSNNCPEQNCFVTRDRNLLTSFTDFDAVLFHARDFNFHNVLQVRTTGLDFLKTFVERF